MLSSMQSNQTASALKSRLAMDQAVEALRSGNPADAEWTLRKHLLEAPRDAAALAKLAELVLSRNRDR